VTKLIYKYLSANFILSLGKIIPKWKANEPYYYEVDNLIKELSQVFCLTKKQLKYYIKGWVLKQDRNFDFKEWWSPTSDSEVNSPWSNVILPVVRQIFSRTIHNDLIPVQPLEAPTGQLFYLDYQFDRQDREFNNRINNDRINELYNNQLDHLQRPI